MDFDEHLAHLAADGEDLDAPVPRKRKTKPDSYFYEDEHEEEYDGHDDAD